MNVTTLMTLRSLHRLNGTLHGVVSTHLQVMLYNASTDDLQHFPVNLDTMSFEDGSRIFCDSFKAAGSQCQYCWPCTGETYSE